MKKLKPCPFCGGKATIIEQTPPKVIRMFWGDKSPEKVLTVGCNTKDCILYHRKGTASLVFMPKGKDLLIERWNHRVADFGCQPCCYTCKHYDYKPDDIYECANEDSYLYTEETEPWDICEEYEAR